VNTTAATARLPRFPQQDGCRNSAELLRAVSPIASISDNGTCEKIQTKKPTATRENLAKPNRRQQAKVEPDAIKPQDFQPDCDHAYVFAPESTDPMEVANNDSRSAGELADGRIGRVHLTR
jgi:hypothetical protein